MNAHCWTRAPSIELCCDEDDSQFPIPDSIGGLKVCKDFIKKGAPKACRKYWPNTRAEQFMCCEGVVDGQDPQEWCTHKDGSGKGVGKNACECAEEKCLNPKWVRKNEIPWL